MLKTRPMINVKKSFGIPEDLSHSSFTSEFRQSVGRIPCLQMRSAFPVECGMLLLCGWTTKSELAKRSGTESQKLIK